MATETILQHWLFTDFVFPFLLIFLICFAILEKTKVLGDNKQLDALLSFVLGLIFVGAVFPKMVVGNLILFLTVSLVVVFVVLLIWGFIAGEEGLKFGDSSKGLKWVIGIAIVLAVVVLLFSVTGIFPGVFDFLFHQSWSEGFWTNFLFIIVIAGAIALVLKSSK
ncbi:MAG: hypothetical protein KJ566_00400 [Nanoarchaeota archaeon]|nr:hypothetical protein [Nanoarchaeota archaeon]